MDKKSNIILVGIILLILGLYIVARNYLNLNFGVDSIAVVGGSFLLLYHTKRKTWSLILGVIFSYTTLINLTSGIDYIGRGFTGAMVYFVPSFIFITLFLDKKIFVFFRFGSILLWLGIFAFLNQLPFFDFFNISWMFFALGLGMITIYILGNRYRNVAKWILICGIILLFLGFSILFGDEFFSFLFSFIPRYFWVLLIGTGIFMVVKGVKNNIR